MITDELYTYIRSQRAAGVSDDDIVAILKEQGGWQDTDIEDVFVMLDAKIASEAEGTEPAATDTSKKNSAVGTSFEAWYGRPNVSAKDLIPDEVVSQSASAQPVPIIAVDVSDHSIEVLQIDKHACVVAYGRTVLEEGLVQNGEITKEDALAAVLHDLINKTVSPTGHGPQEKFTAVITLPEQQTFVHHMVLDSRLSMEMLEMAIQKEVSMFIPFDPKEIVSDYVIVSKTDTDVRILYAAARSATIESYKRVFEKAGAPLMLVDIELEALGRVALSVEEPLSGAIVLDIGDMTTSIGVFDDSRQLFFSTSVPYGGSVATQKIMNQRRLGRAEAEHLKRTYGFKGTDPDKTIAPILEIGFEKIVTEVKSAMGHYTRQTSKRVERVVLSGGSSLIPDVDLFLAKKIGIPVVYRDPRTCLKGAELIGEKKDILYMNVIGLALRVADRLDGINLIGATQHASPHGGRRAVPKSIRGLFSIFKKKTPA